MWRIKLISSLLLCSSVTCSAHAGEFFYANVVRPSSQQIVVSPSSIGGHRAAPASMCSENEPLWCYRSKVFSLAFPRSGFQARIWVHEGFRYEIEKRTKLSLLGSETEVLEIVQKRAGKKAMSFVYSLDRGLIAFQAASPGAPAFLLENRCGLGAPDTCRD